jgi:hypothetical protein
MARLDLMEINIKGEGPHFENLKNKLETDNYVKAFDVELVEQYKIYVGEGSPDPDTKVWIKKTANIKFSDLIDELKKHFEEMPNLELVGADNFIYINVSPNMCILLDRQLTIYTFSDQEDVDQFIAGRLGIL